MYNVLLCKSQICTLVGEIFSTHTIAVEAKCFNTSPMLSVSFIAVVQAISVFPTVLGGRCLRSIK